MSSYFLATVRASLQHAISQKPRISFLRVLAGAHTRSYRVLFGGI